MKDRPILFNAEMVRAILDGRKTQTRRIVNEPTASDRDRTKFACQYGNPGDRLWVKERIQRGYCGDMNRSHYFADGSPTVADAWPWKRDHLTSIHCPRGLSRILLEITGVRVQRLQEIVPRDALREGCPDDMKPLSLHWFHDLWESINSDRGFGWDVNPFVWVIEFKRIKP